ncbi:MAG: protein kinase [Chloroflexi bacterium]|nr:protein kinase [Chloroflexota bacterium]
MSIEPNTLLNNRYRILEQRGGGGMGAVYLAHDENLDVEVAVKENFFVSEESARQFHREAHLLFELRHPGLPRVIDHFVIEGLGQYLVMDFIEGEDGREILKKAEGPLEEGTVVDWAGQLLDALKYLHSRQPPVIHRDVKPANIKITPAGRAILVDFGLAKEYDATKSTTVGARAFTPGFAPPEQYGQGRTDTRTDIYSLGATLYNLLTNKVPADGLRRAMGKERLIAVRDLNPNISPHVAAAIERATEVKPDDRFESAAAFEAALFAPKTMVQSPATKLGTASPSLAPPIAAPKPRRSIVPIVIGAIVMLAIGIGGTLLLFGNSSGAGGSPPPTEAPSSTLVPPTEEPLAAVAEPSDVPTQTPEPTATPEPTEIPAPVETPTPAGTPRGGGAGQIAFASERFGLPQIFRIDLDGGNLTQLTTFVDGACQPSWSPDGERLLFTSPCRDKRDEYRNAAIYVMNADGSGFSPLISLVGGVYDADWSEQGIAFTYLENNLPSLWMAGPDGSAPVKISRGNARDRQPSWSPGGDRLALMNTSRAGSATIFWVFGDGSFTGSNPDQVTRDRAANEPSWSPLGNLIAYVSNIHIWVVPWDSVGFGAVRISDEGPNDGPAWSPDGQWITFETWRDAANHDIYIMTANGGQATRLTNHTAAEYHPAWRP